MLGYIIGGLIVFCAVLVAVRWYYGTKRRYKQAVTKALEDTQDSKVEVITKDMLAGLPKALQTYLKQVGVIGKPRVKWFHVTMSGEMCINKDMPYAPVKADQYTFLDSGVRLFYMTMALKGLTINGLHHYHQSDAFMKVKILDLIQVVHQRGHDMQRAETVTYFNDLCIMAPGGLLEEDITWTELSERCIEGNLRKHGHEVRAVLTFNEDGMIENFISNDRIAVQMNGHKDQVPWSTPIYAYGQVGDFYQGTKGDAVWHYPDGDFTYIRLNIEDIEMNQPLFKKP